METNLHTLMISVSKKGLEWTFLVSGFAQKGGRSAPTPGSNLKASCPTDPQDEKSSCALS